MTLDEKRQLVAQKISDSKIENAENCTSIEEEIFFMVMHGWKGVDEWGDKELDAYLEEHEDDDDEDDDE